MTKSANPTFSVILLAGGIGSRMQSSVPKQFLLLRDKAIALHSFEVFLSMSEVKEIVIVCEVAYESVFKNRHAGKEIRFARPGARRQDSVYSGLQAVSPDEDRLICIHDSARPIIDSDLVGRIVAAADRCDAAVVGVKVKSTIKVCDENGLVKDTPDRSTLWEVQTPQVVRLGLLTAGFAYAHSQNLTVTDDVSLVELLGKPVKIVEGSNGNVKITTPEDLILVQQLMP